MAIAGYTRAEFGEKLNTLVSPAQPIKSIEQLCGRQKELDRIEKALFAAGRHIFIYGDRGVGKSSLAASAASQHQSADAPYIDASCSPDATFASVIANIAYQASKTSRLRTEGHRTSTSMDLKFLKRRTVQESRPNDLHSEIRSVIDAVEVLREVKSIHSGTPVVVVDEFDRMGSSTERSLFADLLKHLGDKAVGIKFIFTGVGRTLDELLGAHQSAIRQLETIELPKLSWDARWDIARSALGAFGIDIDQRTCVRIAAVSDGYPYYVHLITEKLLWCLFEREGEVKCAVWADYQDALPVAIESISAEVKRPYESAISQRSGDYEEVLWSTADSEWLDRYLKDMYSSYEYVMKQIPDREPLNYGKYASRIRSLKGLACGSILITGDRAGLYTYREKMLRGYVRMQAESHGISLIGDQPKGERQVIHVPARSRGYHGSSIPRGVHLGRRR